MLLASGNASVSRATAAGHSVAGSGLAAARFSVVLVAPRCGICLEQRAPPPQSARHPALLAAGVQAPDGWACRAAGSVMPGAHFFCRDCMVAHLDAVLARPGVPPPARLRCPQPGCTRALSDAELGWLIGWDLLLEYLFGAATVAVGWSSYVQSLLRDGGLVTPASIGATDKYTHSEEQNRGAYDGGSHGWGQPGRCLGSRGSGYLRLRRKRLCEWNLLIGSPLSTGEAVPLLARDSRPARTAGFGRAIWSKYLCRLIRLGDHAHQFDLTSWGKAPVALGLTGIQTWDLLLRRKL
jgi:hypothetical protein